MGEKSLPVAIYMSCFDLVLFFGWLYVSYWITIRFIEDGFESFAHTWEELSTLLIVLQILILADILHAPFGLWGESDIPLLKRIWCKVGRRTEFFATIILVPEICNYKIFGFVFATWAISDICRYPFYAMASFQIKLPIIVWLRYSIFIIQYPAVLLAELISIIYALPYLLERGLFPIEIIPGFTFALINYGYMAIGCQLRQLSLFLPYYKILWDARNKRLGNLEQRKKLGQLDGALRCDIPMVNISNAVEEQLKSKSE